MKKKYITAITVIVIVAALGGALLAINHSKKAKAGGMGMPGGKGGWGGGGGFGGGAQETSVRTMTAKNTVLTDFVITNGEIETQTSIEVFPSIGGKVVEMKVSLGSPVKQGDVIAYIDPSEPGSYYAKSPVIAPISGSIISSPVKTGQKVSVSSVITKIGDISNLQVTAKVPERYVADLRIGQRAEITLQAYGSEKFYAKVVRISPVVDAATRTKEIILNFEESYEKVNAGMFAKIKLYTNDYDGYPVIPQDSVVNNNDEYYVFVVKEDNTVEKRHVTLGKNIDGYYQLLEGISEGDSMVIEGMLTLFDGAKVRDVDAPAPAQAQAPATDKPAKEGR
ncbi:MAG: efflux RND transporter periplasmic adaptor subunit [Treponema sp.]|nr:efflux RND transporter periplasmic adaptor subunit [Treponema sp.]